jgi:hypothetical protein
MQERAYKLWIVAFAGAVLILVVMTLSWFEVGATCGPNEKPGPTIGSVFKLYGC